MNKRLKKAQANLKYNRSKKGVLTNRYRNQKTISIKRGMEPPTYSKEEFLFRFLEDETFISIYNNWKISGFLKDLSPSFDRKNDYLPYSFSNIKICTYRENYVKSHSDVLKSINCKKSKSVVGIKNNVTTIYASISEASRKTGAVSSHIIACCKGDRKTSAGYIWKYGLSNPLYNFIKEKIALYDKDFKKWCILNPGKVFNTFSIKIEALKYILKNIYSVKGIETYKEDCLLKYKSIEGLNGWLIHSQICEEILKFK